MIENIKTIIIVILLFLIGFFVLNQHRNIEYKDRIKYDTIRLKSIVEVKSKPIIINHIKHDTTELPPHIDTFRVIDSFYSKNIYADTIKSGNNKIIINDTLQKNQIIGRAVKLELENIILKPIKQRPQTILYFNPTYNGSYNINLLLMRNNLGISGGLTDRGSPSIGIIIKIKSF
jgi:hypothetical protein